MKGSATRVAAALAAAAALAVPARAATPACGSAPAGFAAGVGVVYKNASILTPATGRVAAGDWYEVDCSYVAVSGSEVASAYGWAQGVRIYYTYNNQVTYVQGDRFGPCECFNGPPATFTAPPGAEIHVHVFSDGETVCEPPTGPCAGYTAGAVAAFAGELA